MSHQRLVIRAVPSDHSKSAFWAILAFVVMGEGMAIADLLGLLHDPTEQKWTIVLAMFGMPMLGVLLIRLNKWAHRASNRPYILLVGKCGIVKRHVERCGPPRIRLRWEDVRNVHCFGGVTRVSGRIRCIQFFRSHFDPADWQRFREVLQSYLGSKFEFVEATPRQRRFEALQQRPMWRIVTRWGVIIVVPTIMTLGWGWLALQLVHTEWKLTRALLMASPLLGLVVLFAMSLWEQWRYPAALKRKEV